MRQLAAVHLLCAGVEDRRKSHFAIGCMRILDLWMDKEKLIHKVIG